MKKLITVVAFVLQPFLGWGQCAGFDSTHIQIGNDSGVTMEGENMLCFEDDYVYMLYREEEFVYGVISYEFDDEGTMFTCYILEPVSNYVFRITADGVTDRIYLEDITRGVNVIFYNK